jgi:hypothetical protein
MDQHCVARNLPADRAQFWKEQSQVNSTQAFIAKLSLACIRSPIRGEIVVWLRECSNELVTSSRTFQLAVSLFDLFHAQHPFTEIADLLAIAAAALMVAVNTIEKFEISAEYVSRLPLVTANSRDITELQSFLLAKVDWALDLPTASDIIDFLCATVSETPEKGKWEQWVNRCYQGLSMRFGPFVMVLAGYSALSGAVLEAADSQEMVTALLEECGLVDSVDGDRLDSTVSSSPDRSNK